MKTREQLITDMCLTYRHDYGLQKSSEDLIGSGMTKEEQEFLWNKMAQIYDNCISQYTTIICNEEPTSYGFLRDMGGDL